MMATTPIRGSGQRLRILALYNDGNLDEIRAHIDEAKLDRSFDCQLLIDLAKLGKEAASFVCELISTQKIDETELADKITKEIIGDIERHVDLHLDKYQKYTLNAPEITISSSKAKFFNLIGLLKDVSILGRKLLEASPRFESCNTSTNPPVLKSNQSDKKSLLIKTLNKDSKSQMSEDDATSDDLLAALIESSSSDDFLVLSSSLESISVRDMILTALILITSHECFTLSHDIQGVVMVLRRAKFMIRNILAPKDQMELVARLLTAIGRYNEMTYVFDLFRDRNQFEMLLSKGVEKTPELQIALFNYVKKNPEFYALVTLNFSMFREIAESLEASATKRLDKLIESRKKKKKKRKMSLIVSSGGCGTAAIALSKSKQKEVDSHSDHDQIFAYGAPMEKSNSIASSLSSISRDGGCAGKKGDRAGGINTNSPEANNKPLYSRDSLNLCLVELVDASDCFAKAGCYKRSNDCERRAKLIALQLALLANETNVLDLKQSDLNDLIVSFESFLEAHIVAEAYEHHLSWRQALFRNVVLRGQADYLEDYCMKCDLSPTLVMELVLLYKQYVANANNHLGHEETRRLAYSMQLILARLEDVELKCKLYGQLNFVDAREELLREPAIQAHLRDLRLI